MGVVFFSLLSFLSPLLQLLSISLQEGSILCVFFELIVPLVALEATGRLARIFQGWKDEKATYIISLTAHCFYSHRPSSALEGHLTVWCPSLTFRFFVLSDNVSLFVAGVWKKQSISSVVRQDWTHRRLPRRWCTPPSAMAPFPAPLLFPPSFSCSLVLSVSNS